MSEEEKSNKTIKQVHSTLATDDNIMYVVFEHIRCQYGSQPRTCGVFSDSELAIRCAETRVRKHVSSENCSCGMKGSSLIFDDKDVLWIVGASQHWIKQFNLNKEMNYPL